MTSEVILTTRVYIKPGDLENGTDVGDALHSALESKKHTFNSRENGSIIKILEILSYTNQVSSSGIIVFMVTFSATAFLPEKGKVLDAEVERVMAVGIVCCFHGVRIWVHAEELDGYKWDDRTFRKDECTISVGDTLQVKISTIRYEKKVFSCIGSLLGPNKVL